jgi:hypothetical protein
MPKRVLGLFLVVVSLVSGGCFLRLTLANEIVETLRDDILRYIVAVETQSTVAICADLADFPGRPVTCSYIVDGVEIGSTARFVSELGLFGVIVDPLVLELPVGVTNIAGTYDDGAGHQGSLNIYSSLSYVPVDDTHTLTPGPGKQLVIADLPAGVPVDHVTYDFGLRFEQLGPPGAAPTELRALLAGKVLQNGKTFYPPMLPCVSDFSAVPVLTVPRSIVLEPLALPAGVQGCANKVYFYFRNEAGRSMRCDLDNDHDIDRNDVALVMAVRNRAASPGDPRDVNLDGVVNADDARVCTLECTKARCTP